MKFERLIKDILKENTEYNPSSVTVFDREDALSVFDTIFSIQLGRIINTDKNENLREFKDYILSNRKKFDELVESFLNVTLYTLNNFLKRNYSKSVVKFYLEENSSKPFDLDDRHIYFFGVGIWNSKKIPKLSEEMTDAPTLVPFSGYYSAEILNNDLEAKIKTKGKENIEINDIYQPIGYQFKENYLGRDMFFPIASKNFSINNLPPELFELGEKYVSNQDDQWVPPQVWNDLKKLLKDLTEYKFEDTIKSQKVGRILSKL